MKGSSYVQGVWGDTGWRVGVRTDLVTIVDSIQSDAKIEQVRSKLAKIHFPPLS